MHDGSRSLQMIQLAQQFCEPRDVFFAGIDRLKPVPRRKTRRRRLSPRIAC